MQEKTITSTIHTCQTEELDEVERRLIQEAISATERSYAPYSHFHVGAALLLANGEVTPAAAPALTALCWSAEYISAAGYEDELYRVTYEKGFDEKTLLVDTWFKNEVPIYAEVCYNEQRILRLTITDFHFK